MNPWIRAIRMNGYLAAGDAWARIALMAADCARDCWQRADRQGEHARAEYKRLVRRLRKRRVDAEWEAIEARIRAELDERDESESTQ